VVPVQDLLARLRSALADRYAIEGKLGEGGMATVYVAEDLKHHRKVALKVLKPEIAATIGAQRFLREIELAARLQHPHILPVHDSGDADGFLSRWSDEYRRAFPACAGSAEFFLTPAAPAMQRL
jgi:hypothetical protein